MIISQKLAARLVKEGKAGNKMFVWASGVNHDLTQPEYVAIVRYDIQRIDHYKPTEADLQCWIDDEELV